MKGTLLKVASMLCLLVLTSFGALAQSRTTITGRVLDDSGNPLPGASVVLTASPTTGTTSGADGRFTLDVPALRGTLTVTHVGMDSATVALRAGQTTYNATLFATAIKTEEVVITTGYFNRTRDNFTGSAVVVSGEELRQVNPNNLLQSIQTFDPSFRLAQNNLAGSNPNRLPDINVRGAASLPSGAGTDVLRRDNISNSINMPTFILDGMEVSVEKIYDLDMNRVASISLLKDAAATAIYGSRAANGVLVITTVAPRVGELRLSLNYEVTPSFADLSSYDLLGAKEKLQYEVDAGLYDREVITGMSQQALNQEYYKKYYNVLGGVDTDWLSQPVRNALGHKVSLYLEGGDASMRYGVSGQFQTMPGVMKGSGRDRMGVGVDLSYYLNNKVIFKNVLSVANVTGEDSKYGSFRSYVDMNPYFPIYDPATGHMVQDVYEWGNLLGENKKVILNPMWDSTTGSFSKNKYWEINDIFTLEWFIAEGLKFRALGSYLHQNTSTDIFTSPKANRFYSETDPNKRGEYVDGSGEVEYFDASGTLTYNRNMGKHFLLSALGVNMRTENVKNKTFTSLGFSNDRFTDVGFAQGYPEGGRPVSTFDKARLFGSFLSLNYSYDNRYLIDLSGRLDGSSRFGSNNNVAAFWAAGLGWNVHNESFMESLPIVSRLRLTANTGLTGSDSSNPYQAKTLYTYGDYWYSTGSGVTVTQYGNDDLRWERTINTDFGVELGLWDDRIFASAKFYNKLTKDMLADIALSTSTGFGTYKANLGDVRNRGFELGLKANVFKNDDWNVMLTANMTSNQNRVLKISDELKKTNDKANSQQGWTGDEDGNTNGVNNVGVPLLRYQEGWSFNTIWVVPSMGIDPENGKEIFVTTDGRRTYYWDTRDIIPYKDPEPSIYGFFGGSVFYRGFTLNLSFFTTLGGYTYNSTLVDRVENADARNNVDRRARADRWTTPGEPALYKNIRSTENTNVTSRFIQKENTLELRSVYLSYDFKPAVTEKLGMNTLRLALTANDLWRTSTVKLERGIDYPFARSLTFSLQTSF